MTAFPGWESQTATENAHLRAENAQLRQQLAAKAAWRPGQPLPPDAEPQRAQYEADFAAEADVEARKLAVREAAWQQLRAQAWQPPDGTASLADELARPRQTYPYRIPGLAGWGHNVLVQGPRKVGKTTLEINLGASLSLASARQDPQTGQWAWATAPFLGLSQCWMAGNVAVVNAEMDADDWKDEFRRRPPGSFDAARIFPLHCRGTPLPVITSEAARDWFTAWLRDRRIEVLFIDTWGALCAKNGVRNLNDDGEVRVILDGLDEIKAAAGVASVFVLIHTPHQVPGQRHLERFKGAGAVGDWADTLWSYLADDGTRYLSALGRARIDQPEQALCFDPGTGMLSWGGTGSREQTAVGRQRAAVLAAVAAAGADGIATEDLADAAGGNRTAARRLVRAMARPGGELRAVPGKGREVRYFRAAGATDQEDRGRWNGG